MSYVSTWMGDPFSVLLISLMALWLTLLDQNPFRPCFDGQGFTYVNGQERLIKHLTDWSKVLDQEINVHWQRFSNRLNISDFSQLLRHYNKFIIIKLSIIFQT